MSKVLGCVAASLLLHALPLVVRVEQVSVRALALTPVEVESASTLESERERSVPAGPAETESARELTPPTLPVATAARERRERKPVLAPSAARDVVRAPDVVAPVPAPSDVETAESAASDVTAPTPSSIEPAADGTASGTPAVVGDAAGAPSGPARSVAAPASSARAAGGAGSGELAAERTRYLQRLRQRVLERRQYPYAARRARLEGVICLRLSLDAAGRISELHATCGPSPAPLLEAALRAVREAEPFGPLPSALGQRLSVDVPVVFQLQAQ